MPNSARPLAWGPLALALFLAGPACFDKAPDTGDSGSTGCSPADRVDEGVYGGEHYQLTAKADGSGELLGDCSLATVDALPVSEGEIHWLLTWQSGYGLPVQDTASIETIEVTLDGTYCDGVVDGTLTFPDGSTGAVHVVSGADAEIYACA